MTNSVPNRFPECGCYLEEGMESSNYAAIYLENSWS